MQKLSANLTRSHMDNAQDAMTDSKHILSVSPPKTWLWLIFAIALIVDQVSKYASLAYAQSLENGQISLLPFLDFNLTWNRGISYGLFAANSSLGQWLLVGITSAICLLFVFFLRGERDKFIRIGFVLVISGAVGNIIDRVLHGAVIDFVSLHGFGYYWYIFNIADIWITIGAIFILFANLKALKDERK